MDANYYKKYEPVFGAWYIKRLIGEGSFGQVYEIERNELGATYNAALKTITIPQSQSEIKSIMADGMSRKDVTAYYEGVVSEIISEFQLMSRLKGNSNIVSYEDHQLVKHEDGIGWDILIRMELLTPLFDYVEQNEMTKRDIIKMGIDLCKALELCQKYNIIHRDVKPENIFVSPLGDYKLGDFGIARTAEKTMSGMSRKGTFLYMAPEVYLGKSYGSTVDIYSLGLVMYRMLNDNRAPFLPAYPAPITHTDRENSLIKRISGIEIPPPVNAEGRLAEIVMTACAFDPEKRYRSATQMRMDLEAILYSEHEAKLVYPEGDQVPVKSVHYVDDTEENATVLLEDIDDPTEAPSNIVEPVTSEKPILENEPTTESDDILVKTIADTGSNQTPKKKGLPVIIAAAVVVIGVLAIILSQPRGVQDIVGLEEKEELNVWDKLCPVYEVLPEKYSDEPLTFEVSDEKVISVNKKGEITAKDVGTAELTISAGKYSETVTIVVTQKVTDITNVDSHIEIVEGSTKTIYPKLEPYDYDDIKINYDIINNDIAVINSEGKISAKSPGTTELVIKVGEYKETVKITVTEYVAPTRTYTPSYNYDDNDNHNSNDPFAGLEWE